MKALHYLVPMITIFFYFNFVLVNNFAAADLRR